MSYDPLKDDSLLTEDPLHSPKIQPEKPAQGDEKQDAVSGFEQIWEQITHAGLVEPALRAGTLVLSLIFVLLIIWGMRSFNILAAIEPLPENSQGVLAGGLPTPTPMGYVSSLPALAVPEEASQDSLTRRISLHTNIPTRARVDMLLYTVEEGDSIFGISEKFRLKPETILWANTNTLQDNPHRLQVGQELNIMPTDGTLHKWSLGENLEKVAQYYGVEARTILEYPGNNFNLIDIQNGNPNIEAGTMLIVPGGQRGMIDYGPPRIPRDDPAIARTYGPGHCGTLTDGIVGDGMFIWPSAEHWLSGYDYNPSANHPAIDIAGDTGDPVWAVDDGVVVYSGWSSSGYGNLVVLDHGNDWQSLYAHLNDTYVSCGESVYQGAHIGTIGNTGNSAGDHLHFELMYITGKVNPWNFLP